MREDPFHIALAKYMAGMLAFYVVIAGVDYLFGKVGLIVLFGVIVSFGVIYRKAY